MVGNGQISRRLLPKEAVGQKSSDLGRLYFRNIHHVQRVRSVPMINPCRKFPMALRITFSLYHGGPRKCTRR